jgi:peptide deformylase
MTETKDEVADEQVDAERDARRRFALAQIRQYPDAALRMHARPVEEFDEDLRRLVERMEALMHGANGVGLAANQVGILKRVFVFMPAEDETVAVVNPELADVSAETETDDEGCLSLQGITVPVERSVSVTLLGRNERGEEVRYELRDLAARAAQHELDHLDGVLIVDRTTPEARKAALSALRPRIVLS